MNFTKLFLTGLSALLLAQTPVSVSWASGSESGGGSSSAGDEKKDDDKVEKREEMRRKMREKRTTKCSESCSDGENCCSPKKGSGTESKESDK